MGGGGGGMGGVTITWTADEQIWLDLPNAPRSMCDYAITAHLLHQLPYKWRLVRWCDKQSRETERQL